LRVLKTKWFARFSRRVRIGDQALCEAIQRAESGLIDADLGGNVIKQRVARPGQGRSGGHRVLIAYRRGYRSIFIYGFAKNELDNIGDDQFLTVSELPLPVPLENLQLYRIPKANWGLDRENWAKQPPDDVGSEILP